MGVGVPQFTAIDSLADEITTRQGRAYDLDVLRQSLTLAFLRDHFPNALSPRATACVIGDGFASMTALLLASGSANRVVLINLTKTLLVDLWYLKLWMGEEVFESSVDLATDDENLARALAKPATNEAGWGRVVAIQASDRKLLRNCPVDIALNIASMQEMNPQVIAAYFDDLRAIASQRQLVFYCCNREEKTLPDGTVTRFAAYPWHEGDQILVDELCPWHQKYYAFRPPFYRSYDGPIRHRLLTLA
jgi:putative sugar O-methyltransferase